MDGEQPMGVPNDVPGGDTIMQDDPHVDAHASNFGTGFDGVDTSSIMIMLQNMQLRKMRGMWRILKGEMPLKLHK